MYEILLLKINSYYGMPFYPTLLYNLPHDILIILDFIFQSMFDAEFIVLALNISVIHYNCLIKYIPVSISFYRLIVISGNTTF